MSWIRSFITCAPRIGSTGKLPFEINIKRFALWTDFPKLAVNSIINKTVNTPSITADSNDPNKTNNGVTVNFVSLTMVIKAVHELNPEFIKSNQITKRNSHLTSEFHLMSLKLISSLAPQIKYQH